jgi:hypothetical protein
MNTGSPISLNSRAWRDLYKTVVFGVDKTKLPERIAQAEKALALRARELFYASARRTISEKLGIGLSLPLGHVLSLGLLGLAGDWPCFHAKK